MSSSDHLAETHDEFVADLERHLAEPLELKRATYELRLVTPCPTCGRVWVAGDSGTVAERPGPAEPCCVAFLLAQSKPA